MLVQCKHIKIWRAARLSVKSCDDNETFYVLLSNICQNYCFSLFVYNRILTAIQRIFFCESCPVSSTTVVCNEDFKLCGEVMMMSVMQGGPAPNFLAPPLASYVVGKPLASTKIKNPLFKSACESVSIFALIYN